MKNKFLRVFDAIEGYLLAVPFLTLCLLIVAEVVMRKFFNSGISWLEEFGRYVLIFGTFLGASMAIPTDDHPRMTAVLVAVPHTVRQILKIIGDVICIVALAIVDYFSWLQIASMMRIGTMTSTLPVPMWVPYFIIPLAMAAMVVRFAIETWKDIGLLRKGPETALEGGEG